MKFLTKTPDSRILVEALVYQPKGHNDRLLGLLCNEQRGYCAYTERRFSANDTCAVEHFDPTLKNTPQDDYYNYYATLQSANQRKRRKERRPEAANWSWRSPGVKFFQVPSALEQRIRYVPQGCFYEEIDAGDVEARALIDYLGLNDNVIVEERQNHVKLLRRIFNNHTEWPEQQQLEFLKAHPEMLSFPTALAAGLQLDLDPLL